jgi:hypothetical protein
MLALLVAHWSAELPEMATPLGMGSQNLVPFHRGLGLKSANQLYSL